MKKLLLISIGALLSISIFSQDVKNLYLFEFEDERGTYTKDKIIIPFNLKGNLKGLKLRCYRKGGKRF